MMDDESRQAHFIIGMALFVCILLMMGEYLAAPPVQVVVASDMPASSALTETSDVSMAVPVVSENTSSFLNINTATATELETLPNIGPVLAQRIIDYRDSIGGFTSVEQLLDVSGIGEKILASLREYVTVK